MKNGVFILEGWGENTSLKSCCQFQIYLPDVSTDKEHTKPFIASFLLLSDSNVYSAPTVTPSSPKCQDTAFTLTARSFRKKAMFIITIIHHFPPRCALLLCKRSRERGTCWVWCPSQWLRPCVTSSSKVAARFDHVNSSKLYSAHQLNQHPPK